LIGENCDLWYLSGAHGEIAKISEVGWSKAQKVSPDEGRVMEYDQVLENKGNQCY